MTIYFRADANSKIATGHVMRCCAIASEFSKAGHKVKFILADDKSVNIIDRFGFDFHILKTQWNDMSSEITILSDFILENPCNLLFVDSYYATKNYFNSLKHITKLAYLDDLCNEAYNVDYIINYSIYAKDMNYDSFYKSKTVKLLGPDFIPLRSNFYNIPKHQVKTNVDNILLLTGGSDNYHIALNFANMVIDEGMNYDTHIVCGTFNVDLNKLYALVATNHNIHIHLNVANIETLMCAADIAISAGGSTTYELAACGTPTITYSLADNQIKNVKKWDALNLMDYSGDVRYGYSFKELANMIELFAKDFNKRKNRSAIMQSGTINPYGAKLLVQMLETSLANNNT